MLCKTCNSVMYIKNGQYRLENDNNPETPTKLFYDQTVGCTNPKCPYTEIKSNEIPIESISKGGE